MIHPRANVMGRHGDLLSALLLLIVVYLFIVWIKVAVISNDVDFILFPWVLAIPQILLFTYVFWLVRVKKVIQWKEMGFRLPRKKIYYVVSVFVMPLNLFVAFLYALTVINLGIDRIIPPPIPADILGKGWMISINMIVIALFVPVIEEMFFRGYLLTRLSKGLGSLESIIASSVVFALMHGHAGLWVPVFISSCLISILYLKSKSLYPCILCHGLQNAVVSLVAASA